MTITPHQPHTTGQITTAGNEAEDALIAIARVLVEWTESNPDDSRSIP